MFLPFELAWTISSMTPQATHNKNIRRCIQQLQCGKIQSKHALLRFCVYACVWVQPCSKAQQQPLGSIPPRHIFANKDAQILGIFSRAGKRRDQALTEPSKRTKGRPTTEKCWPLSESKPWNPWTKREKKSSIFREIHSHPLSPSPRKSWTWSFLTAPPQTDSSYVALTLIQETRMDPPNLGRLVSLLVVGLNQPIF